jgi:hypothetical protein
MKIHHPPPPQYSGAEVAGVFRSLAVPAGNWLELAGKRPIKTEETHQMSDLN